MMDDRPELADLHVTAEPATDYSGPSSQRAFSSLPFLPDADPGQIVVRAAKLAPVFALDAVIEAKHEELAALDAERARLLEEGRSEGYATGYEQGRAEAAVAQVQAEQRAQHFFADAERVVVDLAFEVARKVIGAFEPFDVLRRIAERAVRDHADGGRPVIAVAPDREAVMTAVVADIAAHARDLPEIAVKVDPRLSPGRAMLVTRFGSVDLDTESQLEAVRIALRGSSAEASA